jgi:hypothetical protein
VQKPLESGDPRGFNSGSKKAAAIINEVGPGYGICCF